MALKRENDFGSKGYRWCPLCSASIRAGARWCRFCRRTFSPPRVAASPVAPLRCALAAQGWMPDFFALAWKLPRNSFRSHVLMAMESREQLTSAERHSDRVVAARPPDKAVISLLTDLLVQLNAAQIDLSEVLARARFRILGFTYRSIDTERKVREIENLSAYRMPCKFCAESILRNSTFCRFCRSYQSGALPSRGAEEIDEGFLFEIMRHLALRETNLWHGADLGDDLFGRPRTSWRKRAESERLLVAEGPDDFIIDLANLGRRLRSFGRLQEAELILNYAFSIIGSRKESDEPRVASESVVRWELFETYLSAGRVDEANRILGRS